MWASIMPDSKSHALLISHSTLLLSLQVCTARLSACRTRHAVGHVQQVVMVRRWEWCPLSAVVHVVQATRAQQGQPTQLPWHASLDSSPSQDQLFAACALLDDTLTPSL